MDTNSAKLKATKEWAAIQRHKVKAKTFMRMAHEISSLGTCPRKRVGCIITDHRGFILSTGYNGSPARTPHCEDADCILDPHTGQCIRSIHAEMNAIISAANQGVSIKDSSAYVTTRPCNRCTVALIQAGVREIYYDEEYTSESNELFEYFVRESRIRATKLHV